MAVNIMKMVKKDDQIQINIDFDNSESETIIIKKQKH